VVNAEVHPKPSFETLELMRESLINWVNEPPLRPAQHH